MAINNRRSAKPVWIEGATSGSSTGGGGSSLAPASTFDHGRKSSIGTSALQITTTSIPSSHGVTVKAARTNTGVIYVGNSDVTANSADATDGMELYAGESIFIEIDNANKVYCIASAAGQAVFWVVA